jgi:hypothetical protein
MARKATTTAPRKSPPSNPEAAAVGWREQRRQAWPLLPVLLLAGLLVFFAAVTGAMLFDASSAEGRREQFHPRHVAITCGPAGQRGRALNHSMQLSWIAKSEWRSCLLEARLR